MLDNIKEIEILAERQGFLIIQELLITVLCECPFGYQIHRLRIKIGDLSQCGRFVPKLVLTRFIFTIDGVSNKPGL